MSRKTHTKHTFTETIKTFWTFSLLEVNRINQVENKSIQAHQRIFTFLDSNFSKFFKLHNTSQIHFSDLRKIFISKFLLSFVQVFLWTKRKFLTIENFLKKHIRTSREITPSSVSKRTYWSTCYFFVRLVLHNLISKQEVNTCILAIEIELFRKWIPLYVWRKKKNIVIMTILCNMYNRNSHNM